MEETASFLISVYNPLVKTTSYSFLACRFLWLFSICQNQYITLIKYLLIFAFELGI